MDDIREKAKLVFDTLRITLQGKFAGRRNNEQTREEIKQTIMAVLMNAKDTLGIFAPIPRIEVKVDGNEAEITLFDPETGEQLSAADWTAGNYGKRREQ